MKYLPLFLFILLFGACSQLKLKAPERDQEHFVVAWNKSFDPPYDSGNLPIALGSPLIHEGIVYMGTWESEMGAYDVDNGRPLWVKRVPGIKNLKGKVFKQHRMGAPGTIYKDQLVYGSVSGQLYSRHYLTGNLSYQVDLGSPIESKPLVYKNRIIIHLRSHKLVCLDAETGKILWTYKRSVPFLTTVQRAGVPIGVGNKIIVGLADGFVAAFSIDDGLLLWERKLATRSKFIDVDAQALFFAGKIYVGSVAGDLSIIDHNTGQLIRSIPYSISRKPLPYKEGLLVITVDGKIALIDKQGNTIQEKDLGDFALTSLVLWKDKIIVATTGGNLLSLSPKDFQVEDRFEFGSKVSSLFGNLSVEDQKMAAFSSRYRLYVFR